MKKDMMRPEFFQLYSSVDTRMRHQLEIQFQQLTKKISQVNRLLIESSNLVGEKKDFQSFHNDILDAEFRKAFGFTETVIVYLYKLKENDFDRVYVPEKWGIKKKVFMEQAIKDLRRYYLGGEQADKLDRKKHLFLDIIQRVEDHILNDEFQSYTRFLKNIRRDEVTDENGPLNIAPESERIFKNEMLIITPLHNEVGEFWVTVNTYIHKRKSLFGQIRDEQFDLLKKWYVTVHEAISECFLAVAHLLRLREKTLEHETLQRISIISYLLSHPSVKLFTTPLKNAADDLRILNPSFPDGKKRERFESSLDNMKLITDLWEGNLVVLEEFGAIEGDNNYLLDCPKIGSEEWGNIEDSLAKAGQVLFFNHINDLYDDPKYEHLVKPILHQRKLGFSDFFRLKLSLQEGAVCYGHQKLIILHLISFLENAIEAADFTGVAEAYCKYGREIDDRYKNLISYRLFPKGDYISIEVQNDCRVKPQEEENLLALSDYVKTLSPNSLGNSNKVLAERKFTTKSGTGFGWAVILAADYFKRLSVINRGGLKSARRGDLSIEVLRDKSRVPIGVKVRIKLPIPKKPGEKVKIGNTAPEER